jgi:hypothetical protein
MTRLDPAALRIRILKIQEESLWAGPARLAELAKQLRFCYAELVA